MATPVVTPAPDAVWAADGVRVAEVARRLRDLRGAAGEDRHSTLTSVMNLVAWAPSPAEAAEIEEVVDGLIDHHPSRAVIIAAGDGGDRIDARVEVMSHPQRSGQRCLQVEQINLTLRGAVAAHAGSVVIPLLRSELPTFVWWPTAAEPASPTFTDLVRVANRVVTETDRGLRGAEALRRLAATVAATDTPVTDLAWAALTPWRQIIITALRGPALGRLRSGPAQVEVSCPAGDPSLEGLLLQGWLVDTLGPHTQVSCAEGSGTHQVVGVTIRSGADVLVALVRGDDDTVTLASATGGARTIAMPSPRRGELLAGELELRTHDRTFERALVHALGDRGTPPDPAAT